MKKVINCFILIILKGKWLYKLRIKTDLKHTNELALVSTIKEKCRVCYTCVRECPAKAIKVTAGQAYVMTERCIGCGNCVRVCSQKAKLVLNSIDKVASLLKSNFNVVACLAPSFPAEFTQYNYKKLIGILKKIGFDYVVEVAYGAELVANEYKKLLKNNNKQYISSACPAIVSYIEKYYPKLIENISPIVSPMLAIAMAVKKKFGKNTKVVFIGPCIAKKEEAIRNIDKVKIDAVITFSELQEIIIQNNINIEEIESFDFDIPYSGKGIVFPVGGGLLQTADLKEDIILNDIISTEGAKNFIEVIKEIDKKNLKINFIDLLCCDGCIMGPGFESKDSKYNRLESISKYAKDRYISNKDDLFLNIDLKTNFKTNDQRISLPNKEVIKKILEKMNKFSPEDELNCGACGYETCMEHAIAIHKGLAEIEMCLPYTIDKLKKTAQELTESYKQLEDTQQALIQSEKLASMGQLAAGIAHEINNPLGIVLLYSHILLDKCEKDSPVHDDLKMVVNQTNRCKGIVSGLLNFARKNKLIIKHENINLILSNCLKTVKIPQNINVNFNDKKELYADFNVEQLLQVFINIIINAIESMPNGGNLILESEQDQDNILIKIEDTGTGIKKEYLKKIFEPFFTSKQIGKGSGLGLSVSYGIIKMHRGNIEVSSNCDPSQGQLGTIFKILLPIKQPEY